MGGPSGFGGLSFADQIEAEVVRVTAGEPGCAHTCPGACHGGHTCLRLVHGDDQGHVGRQPNGSLVQWAGPCDADSHVAALAHAEQMAAQAKAENAARAHEILTGLDPEVIQAFLDGAAR